MKALSKLPSKRYDLIFSAGAACPCTDLLRSLNLQDWSYPFDWVFGSDFSSRCEYLLNDFQGWFEKDDFKLLEPTSVSKHSVWVNKKTGIIYNHDFKEYSTDINDSYAAVRAKYDRRCGRLLSSLKSAGRIAMVYIDRPDKNNPTACVDEIVRMRKVMCTKFPRKHYFDIYYVHHDASVEVPVIKELAHGVFYITLNYHAAGAEDWAVDLSRLRPIFAGMKLRHSLRWHVYRIIKRMCRR